jgi:hypothetical protein
MFAQISKNPLKWVCGLQLWTQALKGLNLDLMKTIILMNNYVEDGKMVTPLVAIKQITEK